MMPIGFAISQCLKPGAVPCRCVQEGTMAVQNIDRPPEVPAIETLLVAEVVAAHRQHMEQQRQTGLQIDASK